MNDDYPQDGFPPLAVNHFLPQGFPPAEMPPLQRLIMLTLAKKAAEAGDFAWLTVDDVARATGMATRSARKHLADLEGEVFVVRIDRARTGKSTYSALKWWKGGE